MMTIALCVALVCSQPQEYEIQRTPAPEGYDTTTRVVLLDDGTFGATWMQDAARGVHGESFFAKPFVWDGKNLSALPLPKDGYGTVIHGRNGALVGFVLIDYKERPCLWTPDPVGGWGKAKLKVLDDHAGWAVWMEASGTVWITNGQGTAAWKDGKIVRKKIENFDLVGIAKNGRQFGNKFGYYGEGMSRQDERAGYFQNGKWTAMSDDTIATIRAINDDGVAVGRHGSLAVVWKDGKRTVLADGQAGFASAEEVGADGSVLWTRYFDSATHVYLWRNGVSTDITSWISNPVALAINGKGQILSGGGSVMTLLTPKD